MKDKMRGKIKGEMKKGFRKKKSLGQNFLKSKSAVRNIVLSGEIISEDTVLEIGPGKGILTQALLETPAKIIAVEKDDRLIPELKERFAEEIKKEKLQIIHGDILETPIENIIPEGNYKVIANIPYYITGALFRLLLESKNPPTRMVVLVQKEVAERIVARDKKESILSLSIKAYGNPKIIERVSKKMFSPVPKVDSAVLLVSEINKSFFENMGERTFFKWIKAGFSQKRKKVIRNLEAVATKEVLNQIFANLNIDSGSKDEGLTLEQWKNFYKGKPRAEDPV